ncbi:MAG: 3-phosphoshikimate 1-carboxyvinyltransferase, partial [Pseudomonadota bacterium]|nr:3-phosphoshikimate 1-carboxyvinyltransferase [Pseudomonadota bacterium]
ATAAAMRALGATVERVADGRWRVTGNGLGALAEPDDVLNFGNSGTAARLLMGAIASHPITAVMTGDASLRGRPMRRVIDPLAEMGARFTSRDGGRLPLAVTGAAAPLPLTYTLPVASAQVKSAILLAGLNTPGDTTVIEPHATRDHTETMLRPMGAEISVEDHNNGSRHITLRGQPELRATDFTVPGDPSSAAFPAVAALITEGSEIVLKNIGTNPLRFGLFETLIEMGGDIRRENARVIGGEPIADLRVRTSALRAIEVPAARAPSMIDEYPILAVAAARAEGRTVMRGLAELRVKESDRLTATARGLRAIGTQVEETADSLAVAGAGNLPGGATIAANLDHRMAMAFLVAGMATAMPVDIDDARTIDSSFPGFMTLMNGLGARLEMVDEASAP